MVRDIAGTEVVALSSPVDSVHRRHQPEHVLLVQISIEARLRGVTGNRNGVWQSHGTHASARHRHEFHRC